MALPDVVLTLGNGNLGRLPQNQDGECGFIISAAVAPAGATLGQSYQIRSLKDAEALGITEAYDVANLVIAWHHIKEFYEERGGSQPLWIQLVGGTVASMLVVGQAADQMMIASEGRIRVMAFAQVPATVGLKTGGLPTQVITAIASAKAFAIRQFIAHRPVRVLIEGFGIDAPAALTYDLRSLTGPQAEQVAVVIGNNAGLLPTSMASVGNFASVGRVLGRVSRIAVHQNLGRVKDGPLVGVVSAGFSNGSSFAAAADSDTNAINDLGYIFFRNITGLPGVYINEDHVATNIDSDYYSLAAGRTIDKAARITYVVYVRELLDDVELDPTTGYMAVAVVKNLEGIIESAISSQMAGEISGVGAYIDPAQNIQAAGELKVEVTLIQRGTLRKIKVLMAYGISLS